jgi:hypothetical protein
MNYRSLDRHDCGTTLPQKVSGAPPEIDGIIERGWRPAISTRMPPFVEGAFAAVAAAARAAVRSASTDFSISARLALNSETRLGQQRRRNGDQRGHDGGDATEDDRQYAKQDRPPRSPRFDRSASNEAIASSRRFGQRRGRSDPDARWWDQMDVPDHSPLAAPSFP